MPHDYKRNGTTTLFAALNTLNGTVIPETMPRHRHDEWLKCLKRLHQFFGDITEKRIRRGVFRSVPELESAIQAYIENPNAAPKPFICPWIPEDACVLGVTASANDILAKVARARKALDATQGAEATEARREREKA